MMGPDSPAGHEAAVASDVRMAMTESRPLRKLLSCPPLEGKVCAKSIRCTCRVQGAGQRSEVGTHASSTPGSGNAPERCHAPDHHARRLRALAGSSRHRHAACGEGCSGRQAQRRAAASHAHTLRGLTRPVAGLRPRRDVHKGASPNTHTHTHTLDAWYDTWQAPPFPPL